MMDFGSTLCTGKLGERQKLESRFWGIGHWQKARKISPEWDEWFWPTFPTTPQGMRGEVGRGEFLDLSRSEYFIYFFTIFSIFPKAIIHLDIALHIKGKSEGGEKWVLKVVSNPPLNINGFIWKLAFFCMKTCFFPISFPPSSLPLSSGAACEPNLPWAEAALQARACTHSLLQSQQFISTSLPYPTVQAMK